VKTLRPTRRAALRALAGGVLAAAAAPLAAHARPDDVAYAVRQVTRGAPYIKMGRIALDLPEHSDTGTSVPLTVAVASPMTAGDYVRAVHVFANENPRPHLFSAFFTPESGKAEVSTRVRLDGAQTVIAVAEMSDGSFWRGEHYLTVAFGACAELNQAGGGEPEFEAASRIAVPPAVVAGEVLLIRTIITHPMETGLRLDHFNQWVREHIVKRFTCAFNGATVLTVDLYPGIAANPYLAFYAAVRQSGSFAFTWIDNLGPVYRNAAEIKVA
jgi:sulfur-oxidizing protein SoxY